MTASEAQKRDREIQPREDEGVPAQVLRERHGPLRADTAAAEQAGLREVAHPRRHGAILAASAKRGRAPMRESSTHRLFHNSSVMLLRSCRALRSLPYRRGGQRA